MNTENLSHATSSGLQVLPIKRAPKLWRVNGIGTALAGSHRGGFASPMELKQLFFTFLWIPIFPLGLFLVSEQQGVYTFYGRVKFFNFVRANSMRNLLAFYLWVAFESAFIWIILIGLLFGMNYLLGFFGYRLVG